MLMSAYPTPAYMASVFRVTLVLVIPVFASQDLWWAADILSSPFLNLTSSCCTENVVCNPLSLYPHSDKTWPSRKKNSIFVTSLFFLLILLTLIFQRTIYLIFTKSKKRMIVCSGFISHQSKLIFLHTY